MIVFTKSISSELSSYLSSHKYDKIFVLTDTNTREKCFPLLKAALSGRDIVPVTINAGDMHKDIQQVTTIWKVLSDGGASRYSLLINVGGGMVTDLGGFAGATFKRGLHNLNIPTTLMASVDAAVGGKTGINFNGLKNEIGSFYHPDCVMIDCTFLKTLDRDNLLSGYAEMLKHGLISDQKTFYDLLTFDFEHPDFEKLNDLVDISVAIKARFVKADPKEKGIRKALNFGHTVGHAFESLSFAKNNSILHGHAVAAGLISELYLSYKTCKLSVDLLRQATDFIKEHYSPINLQCNEYDECYKLMMHDKKNEGDHINFTLLGDIGDVRINREAGKESVLESLDFYRENIN